MSRIAKLRLLTRDKALRDVFYLTLTQAATLIVPLLTFPWATRVLLPEHYGHYAFGLAVIGYVMILADFGFQYVASAKAVELRDDQLRSDRYYWTVQWAKLLLFLGAVAILLVVAFLSASIRHALPVIIPSLPLVLGTILQSQWLLMARGQLPLPSILGVAIRLVFVVPVFFLVRKPGDEWILALLNAGGFFFAGLAGAAVVWRKRLVRSVRLPRWSEMRAAYADAVHLFIAQGAVNLYGSTNAVMLGLVSNKAELAYFASAERLRGVATTPIVPVTNAYFARISRGLQEDPQGIATLLRNLTIALMLGLGVISLVTVAGADLIVRLVMGPGFSGAVPVLRMLAPIPVLVALNTVLGNIVMVNLGYRKVLSLILTVCGGVNVIMLAFMASLFGGMGAAASLTATEFFVTAAMWLFLRRKGVEVFSRKLVPTAA